MADQGRREGYIADRGWRGLLHGGPGGRRGYMADQGRRGGT